MVTAEIAARKNSHDAVTDLADDTVPREILGFFAKHTRTRFDRLAVLHTLGTEGPKTFLDRALSSLVEQGMVKECVENGVPLYYLNPPSR